ncbi:putative ATP-binding protein [Klebsiella pneumoniae]|uniref:Putative ATP-binding protein n=1 Tax=Klebsiella pneumoniae TaxID=573 RepID=A0A378C370_KLEPN|nr:putative ATP-binding protein [Klebsiella pneumoniae]
MPISMVRRFRPCWVRKTGRPTSPDGTHMAPIMKYGLATNSIGYLVTDDNAMVWRGPMASKALMQMLQGDAVAGS